MGHELQYETNLCGIHSSELHSKVEENEEYKRKIENEIFALIMMDPSKVRNQRRKSKRDEGFDEDDTEWMNNAQYLARLWEELKEQWEDAMCHIIRCGDAESAVENAHKEVDVCPECHCEIEWAKEEVAGEDSKWIRFKDVYKCPKCGKKYNYRDDDYCEDEENLPHPMVVTIKTWSEG